MREKARQLASEDPAATINFCTSISEEMESGTLLYLSTKKFMSDLPNIRVLSISNSKDSLIVAMKKAVELSQGDWFFDELLLPGKPDHKDFAEQLTELVLEMKTEGKRLWTAL